MKALEDLAARLVVKPWAEPAPEPSRLPEVISVLQQQLRHGSSAHPPTDQQRDAVRHFWAHPVLTNLQQARRVCFGLALPLGPQAPALIENTLRFQALLAQVDRWREQPRHFRRAYQGLLHSYFSYDAKAPSAAPAGRSNWEILRRYLDDRCRHIVEPRHNPDWVRRVVASRHLFGEQPGEPYAPALLNGDFTGVTLLRQQLGIGAGSWFLRELVQAQWVAALGLGDGDFIRRISGLLGLLAQHPLLRDDGLRALLNRCAGLPTDSAPHDGLLQVALRSWGDPDDRRRNDRAGADGIAAAEPYSGASADPRWSSVSTAARAMFARWLTLARIAAFFTQPGPHAVAMQRRATFWQRYAPAIGRLRVALDPRALPPAESALAVLLRPLGDDVLSLAGEGTKPHRHALVLSLGAVTLVEFSGVQDALQVYDSAALPFAWRAPLHLGGPPGSSLMGPGPLPPMPHDDGQRGWQTWEAWFEATLKQQFDLRPGAPAPEVPARHVDLSEGLGAAAVSLTAAAPALPGVMQARDADSGADAHWRTAEAAHIPYSRPDLEVFARAHGLPVEDRSAAGGGLWVLSARVDANVDHVLSRWGFAAVPGTGWRR